jgi:formylglycine-generating enzyme required for sulfatase activity
MRLCVIPIVFALVACAAARPNAGNPEPNGQASDASFEDGGDARSDADAGDAGDVDADAGDAGDASAEANTGPCPADMVSIDASFCIDRYEAHLIAIANDGTQEVWPHNQAIDKVEDRTFRAQNRAGAIPQSYVSSVDAEEACENAGKRLCTAAEWRAACLGHRAMTFSYAAKRIPGQCNDNGRSAVGAVFSDLLAKSMAHPAPQPSGKGGASSGDNKKTGKKNGKSSGKASGKNAGKGGKNSSKGGKSSSKSGGKSGNRGKEGVEGGAANRDRGKDKSKRKASIPHGVDMTVWTKLNDPQLGLVEGTVAPSGDRLMCKSDYGVFDMVGNRHEWVSDRTNSGHGIFLGGYFSDVEQNGPGCLYRTDAHAPSYHDYSTGFRCCSETR